MTLPLQKVPGLTMWFLETYYRIVGLLYVWLIAGNLIAQADDGVLRFCVCTNAMPRAGTTVDGQLDGVDVAVARLIADQLGRKCEFQTCASDSCRLKNLRTNKCDAVIGLPHESIDSSELAWTSPYASGKFGLVVCSDEQGIRSPRGLVGKRVGIVAGTIPLSHGDQVIVRVPTREVLLRDFQRSRLDAALVDVDFAAWYLRKHPQLKLRLVKEFVSQHRWSIGIAVRETDRYLQNEISRIIDKALQQARLRPLFAKYGLVHRPPLVDIDSDSTLVERNAWHRIKEKGTLVVGMDPANLPYSSADPEKPGFDVLIAQAVAKELSLKIRIKWIDVHSETAIGQLLDQESDLAFGAAIDPDAMDDEEQLAGKVLYSRPYYGTGYFLIARKGAAPVSGLVDLKGDKARRLGAQAGTIADYSLRQRCYLRRLFGTQIALLNSLENGAIDYAYLWSNSGWLLHTSPEVNASIVSGYVPEDRWNIAVAMRSIDLELKEHVDRAFEKVCRQSVVADAMQKYRVPYFAPFNLSSETEQLDNETLRLGAVQRGLEPDMSGRQHSRHSYDGLARIRSRGTLVVGLDQNNLPFSTTHPGPAGVDYEVAQLLAEQLGLSLKVYWAYSSHDSYPSKLATKRFCDVILGVMPDDRFANRVAYSEPYYFANYVYATAANSAPSKLEEVSLAVEPGIAVRGLNGRSIDRRPDLQSILTAVASHQVPAGYVLSSRAHWLAAENWPGKIRFVRPETDIDQFGICAAVRRNETNLRDAIDEAFQELRTTGQLERAFTNWHIPLDK